MSIEIKPYTMMSKALIIISAVATVAGLIMLPKNSYMIFPLLICWLMPLMAYLIGKGHNKRRMLITDDEIICDNSARVSDSQLAFGGFLDSLTVKRNDIINIDSYFHGNILNFAASTMNLKIMTNDNKRYIIDGRIIDIKAVKMALDGKTQEAEERIKKQSSRSRILCAVCNGFVCLFIIASNYMIFS